MRVSMRTLPAILAAIALLLSLSVGSTLAVGGRTLSTVMTGAQEVPGPGDPNASGTAVITLNPGHETVCYSLTWMNASGEDADPTNDAVWGGHIHIGAAGTAGGIFIHLFGGPPPEDFTAFPSNHSISDCVTADRADILAVLTNPAGYYVNIHSGEYPGGIIRGQLG
jgi:hypothetical protein